MSLTEDPDDIKREATARITSQVHKLALIYSVMSNNESDTLIHLPAFVSAQAVGKYWGKCAGMTLDQIDFDRRSKAERYVMEAVEKVLERDSECTRRKLRNAINKKTMSTDELNKTLEALVNANQLEFDTVGKKHVITLFQEDS